MFRTLILALLAFKKGAWVVCWIFCFFSFKRFWLTVLSIETTLVWLWRSDLESRFVKLKFFDLFCGLGRVVWLKARSFIIFDWAGERKFFRSLVVRLIILSCFLDFLRTVFDVIFVRLIPLRRKVSLISLGSLLRDGTLFTYLELCYLKVLMNFFLCLSNDATCFYDLS